MTCLKEQTNALETAQQKSQNRGSTCPRQVAHSPKREISKGDSQKPNLDMQPKKKKNKNKNRLK